MKNIKVRRINLEFYKQNYLDTLEQAEEVIKEGINAEYILSDDADILADNFMARVMTEIDFYQKHLLIY